MVNKCFNDGDHNSHFIFILYRAKHINGGIQILEIKKSEKI